MSGVNKFAGEDKAKNMSSNIIDPLHNKSVAQSDKVEKASGNLDDMEAPVVKIHQKN